MKLLEENMSKTLSEINHSRLLYHPLPRVMGIKAKISLKTESNLYPKNVPWRQYNNIDHKSWGERQ